MDERYEITQDMNGAVTIRETAEFGGSPNSGYGVSRPIFEARAGTGEFAGQWVVDFADGDGGWSCDDAADATHFATVLQAVMNRHLAAAREEGRREALRIAGLLGHSTERVRLAEQGHDALALVLAVGDADDRHSAAVAELHRRFPDLACTDVEHHRGAQWGDVEPTPGWSGIEGDMVGGVHYVLHDDPAGPRAVSAAGGAVLDVSPDVAGVIDGSSYGATMHLFDKRWRDDAVVTALVKAQEARYGAEVAAENAARTERAKAGGAS